jgi:hypothetical protein
MLHDIYGDGKMASLPGFGKPLRNKRCSDKTPVFQYMERLIVQ